MTAIATENSYVGQFIYQSLIAEVEDVQQYLPGGIWEGVAPEHAAYPFLSYSFVDGSNPLAINSDGAHLSDVGGNLTYLLKVIDQSNSTKKADTSAAWVEATLHKNNGKAIGGGFVYVQKTKPYRTPDLSTDVRYQQIGGWYQFFVDVA